MTETRNRRQSDVVASNLAKHAGHARNDLDRDGLVRLTGVIPPEWLTSARAGVDEYLAGHGSGEHSLVDPEHWQCSTIAELALDERVESFLHSLTFIAETEKPGFAGYRQRVLRILDGSAVDSPPFDWHYDANAVTMLIPIVIPDDGSGQVAMFPDHRPHRRSATLSAAERLFVHNKVYGRRLRRRYESDPEAFTLRLNPGDVYLFRGYRALHATLPWPSSTLRVTLLLQYGHPYGPEGPVLQAVRKRRTANRKRLTHDQADHNSAG
jgi:hypothetical protein